MISKVDSGPSEVEQVWYEPAEVEHFLVVKCQVVEFQGLCLAYSWILLL